MKRCSNELVFRQMQIKITLWRQEAGLQISKKQLGNCSKLLKKKNKKKKPFQDSGNQPKSNNLVRSTYSWNTVEIRVRTVGLCDTPAWGCCHPSPVVRWSGIGFSLDRRLGQLQGQRGSIDLEPKMKTCSPAASPANVAISGASLR